MQAITGFVATGGDPIYCTWRDTEEITRIIPTHPL